MCETCGCGNNEKFKINGPHNHQDESFQHDHDHYGAHTHDHPHENDREQSHGHSASQLINLNVDILARNNMTAALNRRFFEGRKVLCLNIVSSPGSGKTTILEKTISHFRSSKKMYVIEGDQQTNIDAGRIEKAGAPAIQINTGSGCHLDAQMIEAALKKLDPESDSILFIENVGNLVCPSLFDLGEFRRVLVISVTEGDDKPLKYTGMFESSHLCLVNKTDLLPYVDFHSDKFAEHAQAINPRLEIITLSAKTNDGMDKWYNWISDKTDLI